MLINNAGVVSGRSILKLGDDEILRTMMINALAPMWTVKAFLPSMVKRNSGHIVNIGSVLGPPLSSRDIRAIVFFRVSAVCSYLIHRRIWCRTVVGLLRKQICDIWLHRKPPDGAQER